MLLYLLVLFVIILCLVYPILPVSLDSPLVIATTVYLVFGVVFVVMFVLPVCLVPNIVCISGLSPIDFPFPFSLVSIYITGIFTFVLFDLLDNNRGLFK